MGDSEIGKCDICESEHVHLTRTYYYYDVNCECCSPVHFEIVFHCLTCIPEAPKKTTVTIKPSSSRTNH